MSANASVQWKGTDVCMDVYCECGCRGHIDGYFAYYIKCEACGSIYETSPKINLIKISIEQMDGMEPLYFGDSK